LDVNRRKRQPALRLSHARPDAAEAEPVSNRRDRRTSLEQALRGVITRDIFTKPDRLFTPATKAKLATSFLFRSRRRAPCLYLVDGLNLDAAYSIRQDSHLRSALAEIRCYWVGNRLIVLHNDTNSIDGKNSFRHGVFKVYRN
jgi:hypothetical protein